MGKLLRAYHTLLGNFTPAYLGGSDKLRAYLFSIYDGDSHPNIWLKIKTFRDFWLLSAKIKLLFELVITLSRIGWTFLLAIK